MRDRILCSILFILFFCTSAFGKDGDIEFRGALVALSASSVTVGSLTCNITTKTKYQDSEGNEISPSRFDVGDTVKLKCRGVDASELELPDGDDDGGGNGVGGGGNKAKEVHFNNECKKLKNVLTSASGKVEYSYKRDKKGRTDVRFNSIVKIPIPNSVPLLLSEEAAPVTSIRLTLSRADEEYARCTFVFDRLKATGNSKKRAEYKFDIRQIKEELQNKKSSCDVDLDRNGIQAGIPGVKNRDTYEISQVDGAAFLRGTF